MERPNDKEIENQMWKAVEEKGKYSGMSYEEGVEAALRWVLGESEDLPMEDD